MEYFLEFASSSLSLALVALGLLLVQRSHGTAMLELIPLALGLSLLILGSFDPLSSSTLHPPALIVPVGLSLIAVFTLEPYYTRWRLRIAGESSTLLISFAVMNSLLLVMSGFTNARSIPIGLADSRLINGKAHLEGAVIVNGLAVFILVVLYLKRARLIAALQLSKDDSRLLTTFGRKSVSVQRQVLRCAAGLCAVGTLLFVSLQETFAVPNSDAILVPSFAIAITQNRIRMVNLVATAFVFEAARRLLTQYTSELLRDVHQAILFSLFVFVGIGCRWAESVGVISAWRRRILVLAKGSPC